MYVFLLQYSSVFYVNCTFKYTKNNRTTSTFPRFKVAVNISSSGKPVLRYMYYANEPGLTLLMKKTP